MALMVFKVLLRLHQETPIGPGFRPDWVIGSKPERLSAAVWLITETVLPGSAYPAIIQPVRPELWGEVRQMDLLKAVEGSIHIASARVLKVYNAV